jgi:peptide/nickel transport system substrate-binding protein
MGRLGLQSLFSRVRALSSGDLLIAGTLLGILMVLLAYGLYALEREFFVEVPSRGGGLVEGVVGSPRFVNPLLALSDEDRDLTMLTYAGLMGYDAGGVLVPVLAERYEVSPDGLTYTFVLRQNVSFTDGTPVTAEDVVFTVEKTQDPDLKSPRLSDFANIHVEALDARTVRFTLPRAYAPFLEDATLGILPSHIWREVRNAEFPFVKEMEEPVGAGPFKVGQVVRSKEGAVERYALSAFSGYALGRPYLDRLSFVYFTDEDALREALSRGQVESAYGIPGETFLRAPYSRIFGAFFNQGKNEALGKIEVRKALSIAVDRERIAREVLAGFALPTYGPVPPGLAPSSPSQEPLDRVAEAKAVLERNEWTYDEEAGLWENDGTTLSFTLTTGNVPELKAVAQRLREDWAVIGVPVTLEVYDPSELVLSAIRPREYEALLFGMVVGRDKDFYAFWDSSQRQDPGLNVAVYANRAVDELLEELREESDPNALAASLGELDTLIRADYPAVFTHAPEFVYTVPKDLRGVALSTLTSPSDRLASARFWYRHTELVWPVFAK